MDIFEKIGVFVIDNSKKGLLIFIIILIIAFGFTKLGNINQQSIPQNEIKHQDSFSNIVTNKNFVEGIDFVETNNYANRRLEFYYYIPSGIAKRKIESTKVLIAVPGLSGRGENFVTPEIKEFAEEENFVVIAPSFVWDEKNWNTKTSYQYPNAWSGDALIKIVNRVEDEYSLNLSKYYLFGFSAGAQFVLRFSLLHPDMVVACAAHGSGGTITPDKKVNVKYLIGIGNQDTQRTRYAEHFVNTAKYYGIDAIYKRYNIGHGLTKEQMDESLTLFKDTGN